MNAFYKPSTTQDRGRGRGRGRGIGAEHGWGRGRGRETLTKTYTTSIKGLSYARGHEGQFGVIQF